MRCGAFHPSRSSGRGSWLMSGARVKVLLEISSGSSTCARACSRASSSSEGGEIQPRSERSSQLVVGEGAHLALEPGHFLLSEAWPEVVDHQGYELAFSRLAVSHLRLLVSLRRPSLHRKVGKRSTRGLRPDPWGRDLIFQSADLHVEGGQVFAGAGHAGVLRADEAGVWCYGLAHPLDRAGQLGLELSSNDLAEPLAQGIRRRAELVAGLAPAVGEDEQAVAGDYRGGDDAGSVHEAGGGEGHDDAPDADGPHLERGGLGDGALDGERELLGLAFPVVAVHHVLGVLADGPQELAAGVLEAVAD